MKAKILLILCFFLFSVSLQAAQPIQGFWKAVSAKGDGYSVVYVYEYEGKMYGRIIMLYDLDGKLAESYKNPDKRAVDVAGSPYLSGLEIVTQLEDTGKKWKNGTIMDPENGKTYNAEAWIEGDELIIRGKVGPFGRNTTWYSVAEKDLPAELIGNLNFTPNAS